MSSIFVGSLLPHRAIHRGLPTYFRASCRTASQGDGGGYFGVGRTLASHLANEAPVDLENDEWQDEVEALDALIASGCDDETIWHWFKERFPRFMALVPTRRRERFVAGVREARDEEGFGF